MKSLNGEDSDNSEEFLMPMEEDDGSNGNVTVSDSLSVEKILGRKYIKDENGEMDELYFIKWKRMSYLHASWERRSDIERVDLQAKQKIKRFLLTPQAPGIVEHLSTEDIPIELDEDGEPVVRDEGEEIDYFNPDLVEIQRVIACDTPSVSHALARTANELIKGKTNNKKRKHASSASLSSQGGSGEIDEEGVKYLIKWRGQPHDECTWERWDEIKASNYMEVFAFWQLQKSCPKLPIRPKKFPSLQEYVKLDKSPVFGRVKTDKNSGSSGSSSKGSTESLLPAAGNSTTSLADLDDGEGEGEDEEVVEAGLTLRDYQLEGVNWLLWNWWHKRPCILADEMGLGKTIQTIGFLHQLRYMKSTKVSGPFLIVAPLSLVEQWQSEIAVWSPDMNTVLLHGNAEAREAIIEHEFYYKDPYVSKQDASMLKRSGVCKFNILLTTFEVAIKDIRILSKINWSVLIVDEAHKLKNQQSRLFTNLCAIPHEHCILLTGTPLQNKTEELWALLNFTDSVRFGDLNDFISKFGDLKDSSQVARLHEILKPYLLRRIKEDVEKSLPPKEETIVEVTLTAVQKRFYKAIYEKNTQYLYKGLRPSNQPSLMNVMMELRKCCNHPYLVKGVEERVIAEIHPSANVDGSIDLPDGTVVPLTEDGAAATATTVVAAATAAVSSSAVTRAMDVVDSGGATAAANDVVNIPSNVFAGISQEILHKKMVESSGKLVLLDKLLPRLYSQGHKVLIFSQMVRVLNLLEDFLRYKGYSFERLDGGTKCQERKEAVERFCKPSMQRFIMLLSTKAGGLGLNLTAADTVIIFDSDWNPQNDLQAQARAHRIGQTKAVMVYRLLTRKTYEMEMFHQASMKLGLDRAVLAHARTEQEEELQAASASSANNNNGTKKNKNSNFSAKEIDELLKRGAYDVFREDDTEQNEFVEADIESILQRRAHKVVYDNNGGTVSSSLGSFSKASFVSSDETEAVDINDPDFWKKAVGLTEVAAIDLLDDELLPSQRIRKQTQLYGEQPMNEAEIKEILRPIKTGGDKAKVSMTKAQREVAAKERAEREEQKQAKLAAENQAKNDPKTWGPHGRDRVLRALNMFGFGRWEKIKQESGNAGRETKGVESFSRAYILQCGLCASDSEITKNDTDFVKDAINAAKTVDALVRSGQRTLEVPPCLLEEKFLSKLKTGLAKKSLNKLDVLTKLVNMMQKVVEDVYAKHDLVMDVSVDLDTLFNELALSDLISCIPLGDVRPTWTRIREWWDIECDMHMLIGIFKHGYGRYDLIKDDPTLVFQGHLLREFNEMNAANVAAGIGGEEGSSSGVAGAAAAVSNAVEGNNGSVVEGNDGDMMNVSPVRANVADSSVKSSGGIKNSVSRATLQTEDGAEGDEEFDQDEDGNGRSGAMVVDEDGEMISGNREGGPSMPDARSLNRLFCWLVSSDAAKMTKSQLVEKQKLIRKSKAAEAQEKREQARNKMDARDDDEDILLDLSKHQNGTEGGVPVYAEMSMLTQLYDLLDVEAVSVSYKAQIQGLKKCEAMFALPIYNNNNNSSTPVVSPRENTLPTATTATSATSTIKGESTVLTSQSLNAVTAASTAIPVPPVKDELKSEVSEQVESLAGDVDASSTADNVSVVLPASTTATTSVHSDDDAATVATAAAAGGGVSSSDVLMIPSPVKSSHHSLTEFEAVRLTCYFILYGAPINKFSQFGSEKSSILSPIAARNNGVLPSSVLHFMGLESSSVALIGLDQGFISLREWSDVQRRCEIAHSPEVLEQFYQQSWLPFCYSITKKKILSHSQHKYIVPNTKLPPSDHHYAARGLCHIFLIRQQLLYSAYHVLLNELPLLLDYLRSSQGRNVDNMPVWWCPWIHDLGILVGLVKYGFLSIKDIKGDEELPFTAQHVDLHVRQVFLYGCSSMLPAGLDELQTITEAEYFVQLAVLQFPDYKDLEFRVMRILEDVTRGLPSEHPCRVRSYQALKGMSFAASATSTQTLDDASNNNNNKDEDDVDRDLLLLGGGSRGGRKDGLSGAAVSLPLSRGGRTVAKYPAMPLKRFQRETVKRRRLCVAQSHPDCFKGVGVNSATTAATAAAGGVGISQLSAVSAGGLLLTDEDVNDSSMMEE